jgi:hypothetical protein
VKETNEKREIRHKNKKKPEKTRTGEASPSIT